MKVEKIKKKLDALLWQIHNLENVPNIYSINYKTYLKKRNEIYNKMSNILNKLSIQNLQDLSNIYTNRVENQGLSEIIKVLISQTIKQKTNELEQMYYNVL